MEKYFYLDAEHHHTGASFDHPSLQSKPLLFDQSSTTSLISHSFPIFNTPLISNDFHLKPQSSLVSNANTTNFKVPKTEPEEIDFMKQCNHISTKPSLFQLPSLCSLEQNLHTEDSKLDTQSPYQLNSPLSPPPATHLKHDRQRDLARQRRQRVREKIESLKELLPTHKKKRMDTATVLENAGKYIKFLEAQVNVLEAMPVDDCLVTENMSLINGGGGLNRNRVLQIMVNSEVSQGKMSSEGTCVYSVEQLVQIIGRLFTTEEASLLLNSMLFSSFAPL